MQRTVFFDVESSPLPDSYLDTIKPEFEANKTLKDPVKIAADLASKEAAWRERAALDATTGKELVVGLLKEDQMTVIEGDEPRVLIQFWEWLDTELGMGNTVSGFCIFHFDLSFMSKRSWINGVRIPMSVMRSSYRPWHEGLVDIAERWQLGNRDQHISLDRLSKALGVGQKNGDGADFAALYATDKEKAIAYLKNDLVLAQKCYQRMFPI
jgi:hypothetical protein